MLPDIATEIERLEKAGVIEHVEHATFAAPVVVVKKRNGDIRFYTENIFRTLNNGELFLQIDLSDAYRQIPVAKEGQKLLTINTTEGLCKMKRPPFGVKAAPNIFQRLMDTMIKDILGTSAYLDDIIVKAKQEESTRREFTSYATG